MQAASLSWPHTPEAGQQIRQLSICTLSPVAWTDPSTGWVTLGMSLNLPLSQWPHLQNADNKSTCLSGLLQGVKVIPYILKKKKKTGTQEGPCVICPQSRKIINQAPTRVKSHSRHETTKATKTWAALEELPSGWVSQAFSRPP